MLLALHQAKKRWRLEHDATRVGADYGYPAVGPLHIPSADDQVLARNRRRLDGERRGRPRQRERADHLQVAAVEPDDFGGVRIVGLRYEKEDFDFTVAVRVANRRVDDLAVGVIRRRLNVRNRLGVSPI